MNGLPVSDQEQPRPTGQLQPSHERAARALTALADNRIADAGKHIAAIPDSAMLDHAWKLVLSGLLAIERHDLTHASAQLLQGASLAFIEGMSREETVDRDGLRLAARALHHAGWVQRRQERPDYAYQTHRTAYYLRETFGSHEEMWETAIELGLDGDVARRHDEAQKWHRLAVQTAKQALHDPQRRQAVAWTNLCNSLTACGQHEDALAAARTACELWREHAPRDVEVTQASLRLGGALLKRGESLHGSENRLARGFLEEALEQFTVATDDLMAFGTAYATDAKVCLEQKDFAERLLAALDS